jgi:BAHD acyltransferase
MKIPQQVEATELNNARHALDSLISGAPTMDLPEFRFPGDYINPPLRDTPYGLSARVFVFSASTILKLAASLSTFTKERISNFTALTALIWCQITNARREAMLKKGIQKTTVGLAIDHRKRVGSLIPNDYIGNCASGMTVSLPLSTMFSIETMNVEHIAPIALAVSQGLSEINLDWFRARLSAISRQENSSKLLLNVRTCNGPDIFITSWMHIGADDVWATAGTAKIKAEDGEMRRWECKPTAIRKPQSKSEGGIQILPRRKGDEAPFETLICLEEGEMERTIKGLQDGNWVEKIVDG